MLCIRRLTGLLLVLTWANTVAAVGKLFATSMVTCMERSQLRATSFNVTFVRDEHAVVYEMDVQSWVTGYITGDVEVWAYGFKVISEPFDPCNIGWKQFCPMAPSNNIQIQARTEIDKEQADRIPGIAYTVPDIDAYVRAIVRDASTGEQVGCLQTFFSNGKTVNQTSVKWITATIAGLGLITSALLSTYGNSNAASHISANAMSLFLYFQSVVVVCMENVHAVPPIAAAWSENLIWTMGLVRLTFMQKIFRWYVQATGGSPNTYLMTNAFSILTQKKKRALQGAHRLLKRANILYGNENTFIFRGIKRLAYRVGIENTSVVCTGITFFVVFGYLLVALVALFKYGSEVCIKAGFMSHKRFYDFRENWRTVLKGVMLRYAFLGFTQLTILCLWEFTQVDSPAVVLLSVLFLVSIVCVMVWAAFRSITFARASIRIHKNPAAVLYGDENVLNKYGFFYTMYNANHYWWSCVVLSYNFLKAIFIALVASSGKVQAIAVFLLDLGYLVALCIYKPYLDRATNILNIMMSVVITINSFLFLFFSDLFNQPGSVTSIMGWVFFILNASFSLVLLIMVLGYVAIVVFSKNPDLRFRPAKDDRASFQRKSTYDMFDKTHAAELLALGKTAKSHNENWETELHKQNFSQSDTSYSNYLSELDVSRNEAVGEKESMASMLKRKLSLKRNKSTRSEYSPVKDTS